MSLKDVAIVVAILIADVALYFVILKAVGIKDVGIKELLRLL